MSQGSATAQEAARPKKQGFAAALDRLPRSFQKLGLVVLVWAAANAVFRAFKQGWPTSAPACIVLMIMQWLRQSGARIWTHPENGKVILSWGK